MKQFRNTKTMYYVARDHLGSVMALYDDSRTKVEESSYDAWGRRRNPANWTYTSVPTPTITRHGFTGHEHLDKYNLINMNGRVYDPVLGRFLSPDPVTQDPNNTQNYNKYSYVLNNPLKYTDPSGNLSQRVYKLHPPDMDAANHALQMDREAHWALMHGQADGDEFGAFMAAMYGGGTGGGGGGWGGAPSSGDAVGGDGGPDGGDFGDIVASENGLEYSGKFNLSENVGINAGYYVSFSFVVKEVGSSKFLASVFASAFAPVIEQLVDHVNYYGYVDVYDENNQLQSRIQLGEDYFLNDSFEIYGFSYVGMMNVNIKPGYSLMLSVTYCATVNWMGSFYPSTAFTHWFYF